MYLGNPIEPINTMPSVDTRQLGHLQIGVIDGLM